jgi:hypothetical protein
VGFTGATGLETATQSILSWTGVFSPPPLVISAPASIAAGTPSQVTVTAMDRNNSSLGSYSATIHFASSDPAVGLPATDPQVAPFTYPFTTTDNGQHVFDVTLKTAGIQGVFQFSSSDGADTYGDSDGSALPDGNRITFTAADSGPHVFQVAFRPRGMQSLRLTDTLDSTITGTKDDIDVV